jgi:hypothetical protein
VQSSDPLPLLAKRHEAASSKHHVSQGEIELIRRVRYLRSLRAYFGALQRQPTQFEDR